MGIFKNIDDFKKYGVPQLHRQFSWTELEPLIDQAFSMYMEDFVSQVVYEELAEQVASDSLTPDNQALLRKVQLPLAYYTYMGLMTSHAGHVSPQGVTESTSGDGTMRPVSNMTRNDMIRQAAHTADAFMDKLMEFLDRAVQQEDKYPTWQGSLAFREVSSCFVWTSQQLRQHVPFVQSYRALWSIRTHLIWTQENEVQHILGRTLYEELILGRRREVAALTADQERLIQQIQPYMSFQAMLDAFSSHRVQVSNGKVHFATYAGPASSQAVSVNDAGMAYFRNLLQGKIEQARLHLIQYLQDHAALYPSYAAPTDDTTPPPYMPQVGKTRGSTFL